VEKRARAEQATDYNII